MNEETKIQVIDVDVVIELMNERGLNAEALAQKMDCSLKSLKRFLSKSNQRHLKASFLYKLAVALNVTAQSLINKGLLS